jgi:hypothetical protein
MGQGTGTRERGRRGRRPGQGAAERGETLAELLVATTILGIVGVGVVGAIATILIANESDRRASEGETVMRSFVAALEGAGYVACGATAAPYTDTSIGFAPPASRHGVFTARIDGAQTWDGERPGLRFTDCNGSTDSGLQKLELTLEQRVPNRETTRLRATVYKRVDT